MLGRSKPRASHSSFRHWLSSLSRRAFAMLGILWEGDALPLATARQMLFGKTIYRDIWNDKPPLVAMFHLLAGARGGWPLRLLDALYAWMACWAAYRFARDVWSEREGLWAAALTGFFLIFDFPATAIPVASDLLLVAPHLAAVWLAWKRRPFWCGIALGIAFWVSPKALFVLAVCGLWDVSGALFMLTGFAARGWPGRPLVVARGRARRVLDRGLGMGTCVRRKPVRIEPSVERRGPFRELAGLPRGGGGRGARLPLAYARAALEMGCVDCVLARGPHSRDALLPALLFPAAAAVGDHGRSRFHAVRPPRDLGRALAGDPARALRTGLLERPA